MVGYGVKSIQIVTWDKKDVSVYKWRLRKCQNLRQAVKIVIGSRWGSLTALFQSYYKNNTLKTKW